jgi:hypothetical protein
MAATNYTPIQLYFSTTASAVPLAANLAQGELAINITDGKLYYEDNAGVVQVIATKGAGTIGGSTTQIQYNNAGALAGNAAMTFNSGTSTTTLTTLNLTNALGAIYGGTAQSAYAQGDFLYASATNTLSKLSIGTVNYILTSTGSVPQWSAPSSIIVQTATNLAGGAGGSVPYQSAVDTTTFLAIGAANRVMTSSGTVPQWVTALTGLTGVSSSSITNTSLTSGRVVVSTTGGAQADDADLTFDGTTLSAGGYSTVGLSTLVKTVKIGDSNFSGVAVFAAATPAKLYIGTGTVTDTTSAIGATNAVGAVASLAITPIAATNTSVTYTNAATLYIAGAPSAGTNVTLTNPYSLYVAAGAAYFGGTVTFASSIGALTVSSLTDTGLTSGRVTYATTGGLLTDSANMTFNGTTLTASNLATPGVVQFSTNAAQAAGSIAKNATYGLTLYGITGSSYDTTLLNNAGNVALGVTTATQNLVAGGSLLVTTTLTANTAIRVGAASLDELLTINGSAAGFVARITNTTASNPNGLYINSTNAIGTGSALRVDSQGISLLTLNTTGVTLAGGLTAGSTVDILGSSWLKFATVNTLFSTTGVGFFLQAPDISTTPLTIRGNSGATWATVSSSGAAITGTLTTTGTAAINNANLPASTSLALAGAMCLGATTATTGDYLSPGGGNNSTYNGLAILSNARGIATQANNTLPSWIVDIGGRAADGSTYNPNTANKFRVAYVAAGGSYYTAANFFAITSAGNVGINNISPTVRFEANGGENEALTMTSLAGAQGAIGYNHGEIRECGFNVNNASNTVISDIVTTSTGWRVVFRGTWSNNQEGSGLSFYAPYIELNAANPSTLIGSLTLTVSRNGSGYLIANSGGAQHISFAGTVEIYENPQSPQPEQSMRLLGGIQFPATQNATSQANTLDDYEEGTWTVGLQGASSAGTYVLTANGTYTKIGNVVTVQAVISAMTVSSAGTGYAQITGLPFTKSANSLPQGAVYFNSVTLASLTDQVTWSPISESATAIWYFPCTRSGLASANLDITGFTSASSAYFSTTYLTS